MQDNIPFNTSSDVFQWMDGFINLEKGQTNKSFRLDRMQLLAEKAGHPENKLACIHVAGSKGKGSITTMLASILEEAGLIPARYVSPHIIDYRERVGLAFSNFPEHIYVQAGERLREILGIGLEKELLLPGEEEPTFFELMTLFFFLCAELYPCSTAAIETGMGGRLDATNIVTPLVSVISPIELEHTEFLGTSIAAIAAEKAGIIKAGRPVVIAEQSDAALEVFKAKALEMASPLYELGEELSIEDLHITKEGSSASLSFKNRDLFPLPLHLELPLVGEIQVKNAGLALLASRLAFPQITDELLLRGLSKTVLPARFERIRKTPPILIDGAHTEKSVGFACNSFTELYGEEGVLLFACALGKDVQAMARILRPHFSQIIITSPGTFKKSDPKSTYEAFRALGKNTGLELVENTQDAIERALDLVNITKKPLLATGSFYLASALRTYDINKKEISK